jgi:hypothetical protein
MKKTVSLFVVCIMLCSIFGGCAQNPSNEDSFTAWVDDSEPVAALREYVEDVTNEKSKNFIPVEDRIAVFDLDGTLYCETFPIYGEWLLFADYVLNTPDYTPTDELKAVAQELAAIERAGDIPSHMEQTHIYAHAQATMDDVTSMADAAAEEFSQVAERTARQMQEYQESIFTTVNNFKSAVSALGAVTQE